MHLRALLAAAASALVFSSQGVVAQKATAAAELGSQASSQSQFERLVDEYFTYEFKVNPSTATDTGIHDFDGELEDRSAAAMADRAGKDRLFLRRLEAIDASRLNPVSALDYPLLKNHLLADLLDIEQVKTWRRNPDAYSSLASASIYALIKRNFAPAEERLKSAIARERKIPELLANGRKNLSDVPAIYNDIALEQLPGIIDFFSKSVPEAFSCVSDEKLKAEFSTVNAKAIEALASYKQFLKEDLSKRSNGNFALGAALFRKKLQYEEMVDESLPSLAAKGSRELARLQKLFVDTAREIDSTKTPHEVYMSISLDHPKPSELISSTQGALEDIRSFCVNKPICTIPSEERVKVAESPPFERALSFASMDTPGPLERKATEAYYFVTLPEPGWSAEKVEEHMRAFCRMDLVNTSVHESYPGHYVQFLWVKRAPSKVRMLIGCNSNAEGWAHYCEEMMFDEGLMNGDKKLRMVQLHDALLRACRYMVGLKMHTEGMSLAEGINFFMKEGYQERTNAEREAKRGTSDPTYLYYTLGKMQILALRDEYKKLKGADFNLKDFHDRFLAEGYPPVKLVRAALLGENKATLPAGN
jgi:hypothetical protein